VGNAVKYAGCAHIELRDSDERLTILVNDNGPGIPEAELERVFEPYYRRDASRTAGNGGSGLGLGIARRLAQSHGGSLVLANRPCRGLCAVLTLPRINKPGI
jgi:signal transduction histidine kinase